MDGSMYYTILILGYASYFGGAILSLLGLFLIFCGGVSPFKVFCVFLNAAADIAVGYLLITQASVENDLWFGLLVFLFAVYSGATYIFRRLYVHENDRCHLWSISGGEE